MSPVCLETVLVCLVMHAGYQALLVDSQLLEIRHSAKAPFEILDPPPPPGQDYDVIKTS